MDLARVEQAANPSLVKEGLNEMYTALLRRLAYRRCIQAAAGHSKRIRQGVLRAAGHPVPFEVLHAAARPESRQRS
jgi:hypothetical protein